jgi:ubiquinone/menaquinone biosynthesis C-methylase UbiE
MCKTKTTVLDVGCGSGDTMETLMMRLSFKLTVGCDIFCDISLSVPYLDQLRRKKFMTGLFSAMLQSYHLERKASRSV